MGASHQEQHDPSKLLRLVIPTKGLTSYPRLRGILKDLARQMGFKLSIDGADLSTDMAGGMHFRVPGGDGDEERPWIVKMIDGSFGITGGAYNSITIDNTALPNDQQLWVYLEATWTLDVVSDYVQGAVLSTVTLETGASVPANNPAAGIFYVAIARVNNGLLQTQSATRAISATVCDRGTADGAAQHNILQS